MSGLERLEPPPIEQIAYDLRRLGQQRSQGADLRSKAYNAAVLSAYDVRLQLACRALGLDEELGEFEGADRDRERLRLEAALETAGFEFRTTPALDRGSRREPVRGVDSLIGGMVRVLPGDQRERYLEEFRSELHELACAGSSRWQQLRYALRLFDRAWVLRAELREAALRRARS